MKKLLLIVAQMALLFVFVNGQVFKVGALYYTVTDVPLKKAMVVPENYPTRNYSPANKPTGNITIPSTVLNPNDNETYTVTKISKDCFNYDDVLTGIVIPKTVEVVDTGAFGFCSALTSVVFEKGGTNPLRINRNAFGYSNKFETLELPDNLTAIEDYAFLECIKIESVTLSENLIELYETAFFKLDNLKTFICRAQNPPTFKTANKAGEEPNPGAVFLSTDISKVTLWVPEGRSSYYTGNPWQYFKEKKEVVPIEKQVVKVGNLYYKITDLDNKKVMVVPENYPTLNYSPANKPTGNITIPSSINHPGDNQNYTVAKISKQCFIYNNDLTGIIIPNTVEVVDTSAFQECRNLESLIFEEGGVNPAVIRRAAFSYCTKVPELVIPDNYTVIEDWVFENNTAATSVTLPKNLTHLYERSFWELTSLQSLYCRAQNAPTVVPNDGDERDPYPPGIFEWKTNIANVDLFIPVGSSASYSGTPWSSFKSKTEMIFTNNRELKDNSKLSITRNADVITVSGLRNNQHIQIFNINGQLVHDEYVKSNVLQIKLNKGMYIVKTDSEVNKISL